MAKRTSWVSVAMDMRSLDTHCDHWSSQMVERFVRPWTIVSVLIGCFAAINTIEAQANRREQVKPSVVMISGTLKDVDTSGAGIVFGIQSGKVYVATAAHVLWTGDTHANNVKVRFSFNPEATYDAEVLPTRILPTQDSQSLDLAVIAVPIGGTGLQVSSIPFNVIGNPGVLKQGAGVYSIGY